MKHLDAIELKYHSLIRAGIEEQFLYEPETATRNRKPLDRLVDFGAKWELRLGQDNRFRVFYSVSLDQREVRILAMGMNDRNRLFLVGQEVELGRLLQ